MALPSASLLPAMLAVTAAAPAPPATRVGEVVDTVHGVAVADPYRWLEDGEAPEVRAWTEAQNAHTRRALDRLPGRTALEERLWRFQEIGALGTPVVRGRGKSRRLFYTRRDGKQNQPVLYVREAPGKGGKGGKGGDAGKGGKDDDAGTDRALVDVNALASDGTQALDWWFPSEDGRLLAYGVSASGDEKSTLRVRDVASGHDLPDVITRARHASLVWRPDGKGFWYTRYPAPGTYPGEDDYHRHVFYHPLGGDPDADVLVFGEGRDAQDWPDLALSPHGRWLTIMVEQGWAKSEVFLLDTKKKGAVPVALVEKRPALTFVDEVLDDRIYLRSNDGAPRYRLFAVDPLHPARAAWKDVVPESDEILEGASVVGGRLFVRSLRDASSRLRRYALDGRDAEDVPLPGLGSIDGVSGRVDGDVGFFSFVSFLTPTVVMRIDPRTGAQSPWRRLDAPIDPAAYVVEQERATSKDGTAIPYFLVHKKDLVRDGRNPTLLWGYGGFNVNETPAWAPSVGPFLEKGGVYAVAVLRGGGEYGEAWHQAGMLGRKQNVFDDFVAVAESLIATRVTVRERLAIKGGSNGGLLIGAAITQRPELFKAAICGVPLLDMLRYHKFRIARLWIPEYGDPDAADAFRWLAAYSPYHRVTRGTAYPATLLVTAESDSRVDPMHARKMAARLQAAQKGPAPILVRIETKAGHGQGKPVGKVVAQLLDEWSFLFDQLGLAP